MKNVIMTEKTTFEGLTHYYYFVEKSPMDRNNKITIKEGKVLKKQVVGFDKYIKNILEDLRFENEELEYFNEQLKEQKERLAESSEIIQTTKHYIQTTKEKIMRLERDLNYFQEAERILFAYIQLELEKYE